MRLSSRRIYGPLFNLLSQPSLSYFFPQRLDYSSLRMTRSESRPTATNPPKSPVIVQYIFLRRDLQWPVGAMAAQAAHASVAAITQGLASNHAQTIAYVAPENLPHMTKMVYGVDNVVQLEEIRDAWNTLIQSAEGDSLEGDCLRAYWWIEQPENIPVALATWPVERTNKVSKLIKKLNLTYL